MEDKIMRKKIRDFSKFMAVYQYDMVAICQHTGKGCRNQHGNIEFYRGIY